MNQKIENYLLQGCGRCPLGGTPQCKVHSWTKELKTMRSVILECGLSEELKWGVPCYTYGKSNIAILAAFKEYCALSFFKGALLNDPYKILYKPGENSQAARLIKITSMKDVLKIRDYVKDYIFEAVELEKAGLKVPSKSVEEYTVPQEFQNKLNSYPDLKAAFKALTPGRQKGYLLYFSQPKQSQTRLARIEKCVAKILSGKGIHD